MPLLDPLIFRELQVIQKIIQDETWYEGERRGCSVPSSDPVVRAHVCEIILRIGPELRKTILAQLSVDPAPVLRPVHSPGHVQAA